jgi:hypothetical protein
MAVNIFRGARRIALVAGILATAATVGVLISDRPFLTARYSLALPDEPFTRTDETCPEQGGVVYLTALTPQRRSVSVTVCLLPMAFGKDSALLIPYRIDKDGTIWGAAPYSRELTRYERAVEERFRLAKDHGDDLDRESARRRKSDLLKGLVYLVLGLATYWAIVWTVGWIVRGFLGIPRGKDRAEIQSGT